MSQLRVGVIGYGYWGPNVVRNLYALEACEVTALSDKNPAALQKAGRVYPGLRLTTDASEVLTSPDVTKPLSNWPVCLSVTSTSRVMTITDTNASGTPQRFYQSRQP